MFETALDLLMRRYWSEVEPVYVVPVAIARTAPVHRPQPGCASRHAAFRRILSTGRCNHPPYPLVTRCGWVGPAHCSSCESASGPRTHVAHPLTPAGPTKPYRLECGFH